ncbi:LacI family DNA-binding transcriptional regulator [Pontibacter liquoris]|uniref:LacI family DNA-binding transcriptional regulator n=1 Tax=Pontibacter liquoris TaxID=2905677 RepID=UPI001FA7364F|nr:LacI family DNA-binding transcriptional regulator [Pontibacter liquoris]
MEKEITIYDIASALSISPTTVSRGLNNHPAVKKDTRQKILAAASRMGYRSNAFASNLRRQRTHTIGVIVPQLNSSFQSSVMAGMEKVANDAGYNLIISQSLENVQKEIANAKTMFDNRVDGLLVSLAYDTENTDHFTPFFHKGIPLLFYDRVPENRNCTSIVIDNIQAAYKATSHLLAQGCQHLVHISGNLKINVYKDRLKGFKYALLDHNIPFSDSMVIPTDLSEEAGIAAAQQLLTMHPVPDGLFVANDNCAVSCMKTLKQAGIAIPGNMAVVGFNNDPITRVIEPNLTSVDYPGYEMGEVAVRSLINYLDGASDVTITNTITLRSELVVRESSQRKTHV